MQAVRRTAPLLLALSVVLVALPASADCNRPDLLDAVPPNGAVDVPVNAELFARYAVNAVYQDEPITLSRTGGADQSLTGSWDAAELLLSVAPTLEPKADYRITWPRLRGLNSANLGRNAQVSFTVGTELDQTAPDFGGLTGLDWDVDRERDDCTDNLEDRYTFDFELGAADDDGGRDSLMLVVFQTRGPHVSSDAPEPVLVRRMPKAGAGVRVTRTLDDGVGDVCFAAIARDLTGKASASGAKEICTTTVAPPFFYGCSLASALPRSTGALSSSIALGALLWFARRRGRSR